ncbi:MAG: HD domain-containing protein [Acholeplasmatales bacterium]|nr:HD domain-containing protein [Acholeplasmatales bacterium]
MNSQLYKYAEKRANRFNMICILVIGILGLVVLLLNEVGVFTAEKLMMRLAMIELFIHSLIPLGIYIVHDKLLEKEISVLEYNWFKILIIIISYYSILELNIAFSFHAILVLSIPTLLSAQYKNSKKLTVLTYIFSILLVIFSIYGSYIFGMYDANLLKPLTSAEAEDVNNRLSALTFKRFIEVFFHYCSPNIICITAIDFIGFSITKRNSIMIEEQVMLNNKVQDEILAKNHLQNSVIEHLADIIESRDIETGEHIKRTKKYVSILVNKMREDPKYNNILNDKMTEYIINAAPLHDIGKIAVSDLILCKPGKLTDEEFDKMKIHTTKGGEIIKSILNDLGDKEFLNVAYDVAMYHHEKWNGRGYPEGKKEEEIPLPARIMAIADVFDALVAERVYKKPMPVDDAINIIIKDAGTHFDPNIVEIFKTVLEDFKKVQAE